MNKKGWLIPLLIVVANASAIILQWNELPKILPAHFDLQGNASGSISRNILILYFLASIAVCKIAYLISLKMRKFQTGLIILASVISLILLLSTLVSLTSGTMPVFMLAEPVVLLATIVAFVVCIVKSRKRLCTRSGRERR